MDHPAVSEVVQQCFHLPRNVEHIRRCTENEQFGLLHSGKNRGKRGRAAAFLLLSPDINRIRMDMVKRGEMMSVEDVTEILPIDLIGAIPDDEQVVIGTNQGEAVVDMDSLAGKAYTNICRRITGEEVPFLDLDKQESLFYKLSHMFKRN